MRLFTPLVALATAQEQLCAEPDAIDNAQYTRDQNNAAFTCDVGFCFADERIRTINSSCQEGAWSKVGSCVPCSKCSLPATDPNMEVSWVFGTWDAKLVCKEGVIKPGTDDTEMTISCIENEEWNSEIPVCSNPSTINCEDGYMEAVIDKNLLRAKNWNGDAGNIFMSGPGSMNMALSSVDPDCFAVADSSGNYVLRINSPYMDKCGTVSSIVGSDYIFTNQVIWQYETIHSIKSAHLLEFKCIYNGEFMVNLDPKIKLAINTKLHHDPRTNQDFTVSMSVYDKMDFSGLVDNIPILHRGKRYFVDLHMHNKDLGTPYLKHCYGSNNFVSELELKAKYGMQTTSSSIREMIINGCPAPKTLVRLEAAPNTYQSRYSFMFPKIGRGLADLQFVYLHCEIEIRQFGYAPVCSDSLFGEAIRRNLSKKQSLLGFGRSQGKKTPNALGHPQMGSLDKENMCKLPWMLGRSICQGVRK